MMEDEDINYTIPSGEESEGRSDGKKEDPHKGDSSLKTAAKNTTGIKKSNQQKEIEPSQKQTSMKDALMKGIFSEAKSKNMVRIRLSADCKQKDRNKLSLVTEIKRIIVNFDKVLRLADAKARIAKWASTNLTENAEKMNPYDAEDYIDIPEYLNKYLGNKKQSRIGKRISTDLSVDEFINTWGEMRKADGWSYAKRAEMQNSPTVIPVGICQGSSTRKDLKTLNATLSAHVGF